MVRKLFFWMPLVLVGSLVYWSLAVSLGGMSLWAVWPSTDAVEKDIYQPITVRLVGEVAPGDLAPSDLSSSLVDCTNSIPEPASTGLSDPTPPTLGPTQGPGDTAF